MARLAFSRSVIAIWPVYTDWYIRASPVYIGRVVSRETGQPLALVSASWRSPAGSIWCTATTLATRRARERTGMRTSELIALEWGDIDPVRQVARVRRASVRKILKVPKTQAGERDVVLLAGARSALDAQKATCPQVRPP